ncbi:MAG: redoxin domain-containing protein [Gemmatimonadota bacterium]
MTAYRDQYASLFNNGRNVVMLGITQDPVEDLHDWLHETDFPFVFASDGVNDADTYARYGGPLRDEDGTANIDRRTVVVVDSEGNVAAVIPQFRQVDPTAYEELAEIVDRVTPEAEDVEP